MRGALLLLISSALPACGAGDRRAEGRVVVAPAVTEVRCDVVILGGTTAAFAAAVASAEEGAATCLLEPTDWVGGQLTATGVPAIDWAWHKIGDYDVAAVDRARENQTPSFGAAMAAIGNPGHCWVSVNCFEPRALLSAFLDPLEARLRDRLTVFRSTVVKSVDLDGDVLRSLTAIQRIARPGVAVGGYDLLPSQDLPDWYDPAPSARHDKKRLRFSPPPGRAGVFVDASDWGELLALSGAPYLQGMSERFDGDAAGVGDDRCGQATVFGLVERLDANPVDEPDTTLHPERYSLEGFPWDKVWTYRRLRGSGAPATGDLSLQNWGKGNDYPLGYLFLSREEAARSRGDWRGGVDLAVMAAAEQHALGWHAWLKRQSPTLGPRIALDRGVLGTGHGLSKLPYIRDTRRAVGLDGFVLTADDLTTSSGGDPAQPGGVTARPFADRVAIGLYAMDIHPIQGCAFPAYVLAQHTTLPFYLPFRALTTARLSNLLVAGKTMAQSFLAGAATRLQPIEWSSGTAAGVAAAWMASEAIGAREALRRVAELQPRVARRTPIDWTIRGAKHLPPGAAGAW